AKDEKENRPQQRQKLIRWIGVVVMCVGRCSMSVLAVPVSMIAMAMLIVGDMRLNRFVMIVRTQHWLGDLIPNEDQKYFEQVPKQTLGWLTALDALCQL